MKCSMSRARISSGPWDMSCCRLMYYWLFFVTLWDMASGIEFIAGPSCTKRVDSPSKTASRYLQAAQSVLWGEQSCLAVFGTCSAGGLCKTGLVRLNQFYFRKKWTSIVGWCTAACTCTRYLLYLYIHKYKAFYFDSNKVKKKNGVSVTWMLTSMCVCGAQRTLHKGKTLSSMLFKTN